MEGKVAQPSRPPVDPSGTGVTVPGWTPVNSHIPPTPFFGSMSAPRGVAGCFCLAPVCGAANSTFSEGQDAARFFAGPFWVKRSAFFAHCAAQFPHIQPWLTMSHRPSHPAFTQLSPSFRPAFTQLAPSFHPAFTQAPPPIPRPGYWQGAWGSRPCSSQLPLRSTNPFKNREMLTKNTPSFANAAICPSNGSPNLPHGV